MSPDGVNLARNLVVRTDSAGLASVWLTLGTEASPGGNSVRAWSEHFGEDVIFTATATRGLPFYTLIDRGPSAQFVQTDAPPVDALSAAVFDRHYNRMIGVAVRYKIVNGEAKFTAMPGAVLAPDTQSITVTTDKNGTASVRPLAGRTPGTVRILAQAMLSPTTVAGQAMFQLMVLERKTDPT